MKFDDMLSEVRDTLEREGRIAYRVLKRRYELDDDDIEDIKADFIDAKRLAVDENGKVLVWADDGAHAEAGAIQVPAEADRRLLTVMFCDVVDSTALSEKLDPEELRDLIRQYQRTCSEVIERFAGHVAQYLGDGLLVYFGYPVAQEDEAYQAVRSGIDILQALRTAEDITAQLGEPLRVRIGIHTGPVVIGEMGTSRRHEHLALGDTPNIAARVQGMARPDEILISESTQRLVEGLFEVEALGAQDLKGVSNQLDLYRVSCESTAESQFEVALSTGRLTRFVGQEEELTLLNQHWIQARNAKGQVILVSAEPGMGKSRLAQEFKDRIAEQEVRHMAFRCSPYHQSSAFFPIIQVMQRALLFDSDDTGADKLAKLEATLAGYEFSRTDAAPLMSGLLSLPHPALESVHPRSAHEHRERLFQILTEWFLEESRRNSVYMIWDDLHWADPSTLAFLEYFLDHVPTSSTLALLIYRSHYSPPWKQRGFFRHLSLNRLNDAHVAELAADVAGEQDIPAPLIEEIKIRTDGIPLYVEELTRTVVESGLLDAQISDAGEATIGQILIPMTLQDSLEARLDRCPAGKEIAQWGATIGREFSHAILRSVVGDDSKIGNGINELLDAELIYRSGSPSEPTFIFKHALLRDTAYESLLIRRRRDYHGQIAKTMEAEFSHFGETQPEVIAGHYTEGQLVDDAVRYWLRAGRYAISRSADQEAMQHLEKGLEQLKSVPRTTARMRMELDLLLLLGTLIIGSKGNAAPEVETVYRRALSLCDDIGDSAAKAPVLFGLRSFYLTKGDLNAEHEISRALLEAAEIEGSEDALLEAHVALTNSFFYLGDVAKVFEHATTASQIYDIRRHQAHAALYSLDPGALSYVRLAQTAWHRGHAGKAKELFDKAVAIGDEIAHPLTQAFTLSNVATFYHWSRNHEQAAHYTKAALALATEYGFPAYQAWAKVQHGSTLVHLGGTETGLAEIEDGMRMTAEANNRLIYPWFAVLHAEALGVAGDPERGLVILPEAIAIMEDTGARFIEAYLYYAKGELLRQDKLFSEAERAFEQTIEISQSRGLNLQALRAAIAIAEVRRARGDIGDAASRLRKVCEDFEGDPGSPDLRHAKALAEAMT